MTNPWQREILIRRAYADDRSDLIRLAALDSVASPPPAPLLVAELDGVLSVALSLTDGSAIADPFKPTTEIVDLLRLHAAAGQAADSLRSARAWLGRLLAPMRWAAL
jgi:hypothetical protein